jgi:hypothetical protein
MPGARPGLRCTRCAWRARRSRRAASGLAECRVRMALLAPAHRLLPIEAAAVHGLLAHDEGIARFELRCHNLTGRQGCRNDPPRQADQWTRERVAARRICVIRRSPPGRRTRHRWKRGKKIDTGWRMSADGELRPGHDARAEDLLRQARDGRMPTNSVDCTRGLARDALADYPGGDCAAV